MESTLFYQLCLNFLPHIGDILAKRLVAHCGGVEAVFVEHKRALLKVPGIGLAAANAISKRDVFERAEKEMRFIEREGIIPIFYLDEKYPYRLEQAEDSPILLFFKGNASLNHQKVISVVGTRQADDCGKNLCDQLIHDLAAQDVQIISGMAYGIDICAHRAAIKNKLPTIAVFAHGLDRIYPSMHRSTAIKMLEQGAWLTDFPSDTIPDRENFPKRNRIVAGMADATIVIQSQKSGGSLITADIANSYNRDVFAFPGAIGDGNFAGCNQLIKNNKAALIESAKDVIQFLQWDVKNKKRKIIQTNLFHSLNEEERKIVQVLKDKGKTAVDDLCIYTKISIHTISGVLLNLEFAGIVKSLPGKVYGLTA